MPVEVKIPTLGESVNEGVIVRWLRPDGAVVQVDDPLLELETDKASVEIPAPAAGVLQILKPEGTTVQVGATVARLDTEAARTAGTPPPSSGSPPASSKGAQPTEPAPTPRASGSPQPMRALQAGDAMSPAVRRLVEENKLEPAAIPGTGRGGRLTKGDVLAHLEAARTAPPGGGEAGSAVHAPPPSPPPSPPLRETPRAAAPAGAEIERVPMSRLRQRIAERLVQAQRTAAILTTFNEIDMSAVLDLRSRYKARFAETHGVPLGFMSFFARACIAALKHVPVVGAHIEGTDIVYNKHVHLGVAVATERGLVVPVVRDADQKSFAEIEKEIERLAGLARQNKLSIEDLSGGTFTISNGGVYGSLLSTPILNPPQSGILGMHKIEKRPVVVDDQIVVRPMMYVALSYDHRLIDGKDAVTFLVRVKEAIEDPTRLLLDL